MTYMHIYTIEEHEKGERSDPKGDEPLNQNGDCLAEDHYMYVFLSLSICIC